MTKKICLNEKSKCSMLVLAFVCFLFVIFHFWNFNIMRASANPDYICIKNVVDSPCEVTSCWDWQTNWTRECTWRKTTQVAYYLIRTSCEPWYTKIGLWGNSSWASWRNSSDYATKTESCNVVQVDHVSPTWDVN